MFKQSRRIIAVVLVSLLLFPSSWAEAAQFQTAGRTFFGRNEPNVSFEQQALQSYGVWMGRPLSEHPIVAYALRITSAITAGYLLHHSYRAIASSITHQWSDVVSVILLVGMTFLSSSGENSDFLRARALSQLGKFSEAVDVLTNLRASSQMTPRLLTRLNAELASDLKSMNAEPAKCLMMIEPSVVLAKRMVENEPVLGRMALAQSYYFQATYYLDNEDADDALRDSKEGLQALRNGALIENSDPEIVKLRTAYQARHNFIQGKVQSILSGVTLEKSDMQETVRLMTEAIAELRTVFPFNADHSTLSHEQAHMLVSLGISMGDLTIHAKDAAETENLCERIELQMQEAERLDPDNVDNVLLKGRLAQIRGDYASAIASFEEGYRRAPNHPKSNFASLLALVNFLQDSHEESLRWSFKINQPSEIDLHFRALNFYKLNRYREAIPIWEHLLDNLDSSSLSIMGYSRAIYPGLICCYLAVQDAPKAQALLQKYLKKNNPDEMFVNNLAGGLYSRGLFGYFGKTWTSRQKRDNQLRGLVWEAHKTLIDQHGEVAAFDFEYEAMRRNAADQDAANTRIENVRAQIRDGHDDKAFEQLELLVQEDRLPTPLAIESALNLFLVLWKKYPNLTPLDKKIALLSMLYEKIQSLGKENKSRELVLETKISTAEGKICVRGSQWKEGDIYLARARKGLEGFKPDNVASEKQKDVAVIVYNAYHWWWFLPRYRWLALGDAKDLRLSLERLQLSRQPLEGFSYFP